MGQSRPGRADSRSGHVCCAAHYTAARSSLSVPRATIIKRHPATAFAAPSVHPMAHVSIRHDAICNVIGNCVATVVVAAWEGDLDHVKAKPVLEGDELVDVTAG
jgi:Na+/H+-dicarboxylate symporter